MENLPQLRRVVRHLRFQHHVGAMKGDDARFIPALDKGKQVHPGVPKINVHQVGPATLEQVGEQLVLSPIDDRRLALDKFEPAVAKRIRTRCRDQLNVVERKPIRVLHLLRHHESLHIAEGGDLPVDVEHLRFKKSCAVTCDDQFRHNNRGTPSRLRPKVGNS